jgi:hypothetical protein
MVCLLWRKFENWLTGKPGRNRYIDSVKKISDFLRKNTGEIYYSQSMSTDKIDVVVKFLLVEKKSSNFFDYNFVFEDKKGFQKNFGLKDLTNVYFHDDYGNKSTLLQVLGHKDEHIISHMDYL